MEIINLSERNSIINQYMAEIRDKEYQKNRLLFRNNIMRIGEFEAFELSSTSSTTPATPSSAPIANTRTPNTTRWAFTWSTWPRRA